MIQKTLFEPGANKHASGLVPAARRTDPISSHLAAKNAVEIAVSARAAIMEELRRQDGQTAGEIAAHLGDGWTNVQVSRRMPELERDGRVTRSERPRVCSIRGVPMIEWRVL